MNYNIQSLRAFAAIAVMLFHAIPFYERAGGSLGFVRPMLANGYAGVDLFFVLSGFIIAKSFGTRIQDFTAVKRFLEKRAYRIFVGYWPLLLLVTLFYLELMPHRLEQVSGIKSFFLLSNRIPDLVIGQSWSLSHELFFYFAFGLLTLIDRVISNMIVVVYGAAIVVANVTDPNVAKGFFLNPHFLELFAGMFLGKSSMTRFGRVELLLLVPAAALLLVLWGALVTPAPLTRAVVLGGAAFALVASADVLRNAGINRVSIMSRLGDSSYSLYLVHYFLLEVFAAYLLPADALKPYLPQFFWVWVVLIVMAAHIFHFAIEKPLYDTVCASRGLRTLRAELSPREAER
ncbi:MAG: acyltransferase [Sterolibacteriaceae bacterium]|nr:acyltransferase [Candidatus Methylophosphatis haderslevensis]